MAETAGPLRCFVFARAPEAVDLFLEALDIAEGAGNRIASNSVSEMLLRRRWLDMSRSGDERGGPSTRARTTRGRS